MRTPLSPSSRYSRRPRTLGFTLVELMVVVAVLAIFASIALPSFASLIASNRLQSTASEFMRLFQSARSDAVTLRAPQTVCASSDGSGWTLVQASGCGTTGTVRARVDLPSGVSLSPTATSVTFAADGSAADAQLTFSSSKTSKQYVLKVVPAGYLTLTTGTAG
jgi:type IV fimbrial biogenesis protein FimT/type IV fimbrial biogenesis protein FimU